MKRHSSKERGQALIIVAFAIIGLVGIVGLAIDGSIAFSDRRRAQNAADAAAFAGAYGKINPIIDPDTGVQLNAYDSMQYLARERADSNGFYGDLIHNQVEVYLCSDAEASCEEPYNTRNPGDYVQVIITSHVNTFFARVLGIPQVHNRVQSVVLAKDDVIEPLFPGESIIALSPDCINPGTLILQGTGDITLNGGGLFINSNGTCGFDCDSNSVTLDIINGDITTAGSTFDSVSDQCSENITAPTSTDAEQFNYPDDLPDIPEPTEWCDPNLHLGSYWNDNVNRVTYLYPGYYGNFPPQKTQPLGALYDRIIMMSGIYCVGETVKLSDRNLILESEYGTTDVDGDGDVDSLDGEGVTIYIRPGFGFRLEGGTFHLKAQAVAPYTNYLFIVAPPDDPDGYPDTWGQPEACVINGNTNDEFEGGIYAPYCNITVNGSAGNIGFNAQVIGYTVDITGGAGLNFTYDGEKVPVTEKPAQVGQTK